MVEVFNHAQVSDNTAAVTDRSKENNAANLAVGSWKEMEKMSVNKAAPGETKCIEFDDIYKKGGAANTAGADTHIKKQQNATDSLGKPNASAGDTEVKKVPHDGGMKEPMGKPNAAESDTTIYKKSHDGGSKESMGKSNAAAGDTSITKTPDDGGSKLQDNIPNKAEQMKSKGSEKVIFDVDQVEWQKLFPKDK